MVNTYTIRNTYPLPLIEELINKLVTTLTPFSFSPVTDTLVGCLPELFLAYCTIVDTSSPDSCSDSRAIPDMMADDPMPLLSLNSNY